MWNNVKGQSVDSVLVAWSYIG